MSYVRSEIAAMSGYVPGEQPCEGSVVKLNTNENPYRASEKVNAAIRRTLKKGLSRYPDPAASEVRNVVAKKFGVCCDSVLCGNGSDDLLTILTRTFIGSGDVLRLPYPTYILYRSLAEIQGAKSETVPFRPDWTLSDDIHRRTEADNLRLVFLANPNSPSGTVIPKEQILDIAEKLPCPLVVDEAYADFAEEHCIDLVKRCEKIIVCRTMSKSYSLAGLRFGYLVAQPHLVEEMMKVKDSYNCDSLSIAAAAAALSDDDWLADNRRKIIVTRKRLADQVRALGFTVPDSHANFIWAAYPGKPLKTIYEFLKAGGILVRYMAYPNWGDGLRISVGTDEQVDRCIELLEKGI
ncbi:MAG: histidinol-phosphate transaminase [Planctomycetaceae bacterium]|jgi:histidinol-phosphate aminotransferase|nr:histidinol-phosphate transaminase [Planctomycetaceae bacterium]